MTRRLSLPLLMLVLLSACGQFVDDRRADIRGWCSGNPDWCSMQAVK